MEVRRYRPNIRDEVLDFFRTVYDDRSVEEWFRWKYEAYPFSESVPLFVAESGSEIVGVHPYLPLPMSANGDPIRAALDVNIFVHPAHRGEGVFSEMKSCVNDRLADTISLQFAFANQNSRPIYRHWGWTEVSPVQTYYRIQNPGRIVDAVGNSRLLGALVRVGRIGMRAYLTFCDTVTAPSSGQFEVTRTESVSAERMVGLTRSHPPEALHIRPQEAYYDWRFSNLSDGYRTYSASQDEQTVAAVITRSHTRLGFEMTEVVEVVPGTGSEQWEAAVDALLTEVLLDHRDVDMIVVPDGSRSRTTMWSQGFVPNDAWPMSRVGGMPLTLLARKCGEISVDIENWSNWVIPRIMQETD